MNDVPTPIDRGDLSLGAEIGRGGQAAVYELHDPPQPGLLLKHYLVPVDEAALDRVIAWRHALGHRDRTIIDAHTSWPQQRVTTNGTTSGVLIPHAPAAFVQDLRGNDRLRELSYLTHADRSIKLGIPLPDAPNRLHLLANMARVFDVLQRNDVVHGDISFKNVLWSVYPTPAVYLLDCDSVTIGGQAPALPMATTPHWTDPRLVTGAISAPDLDSDRLALGLACYRGYFQTAGNIDNSDPRLPIPPHPPIDDYTRSLFERTLTLAIPRPHPEEWLVLEDLAIDLADPSTTIHQQMHAFVPPPSATETASIPVYDKTVPVTPPSGPPVAAPAVATPAGAVAPTASDSLSAGAVFAALAIFMACLAIGFVLARGVL